MLNLSSPKNWIKLKTQWDKKYLKLTYAFYTYVYIRTWSKCHIHTKTVRLSRPEISRFLLLPLVLFRHVPLTVPVLRPHPLLTRSFNWLITNSPNIERCDTINCAVCGHSIVGIVGSNTAGDRKFVSCECCVLSEASSSGRYFVQMSPTKCGVSEFDREASIMRRPWPTRCSCAMGGIQPCVVGAIDKAVK